MRGRFAGLPTDHRFARRADFIHAARTREMRRLEHQLRIVFDLLRNGDHRVGEQVEFALAFRLRRLDHQSARHDQREADGVRMKAVIDQPLGDVAGAHALLRLPRYR